MIGPSERGLSFDQMRQVKREKEQEIILQQDDIQLKQKKYVNGLIIFEIHQSSLVQQQVQAWQNSIKK